MPARPSPVCCRALQSHKTTPTTTASVEAVWVTDDLLRRAFQRYLDVSVPKGQRRAVSFAPGPMYHRKRFGRREMTDLNSFQTVGSLPTWALPNAPDMSKWQWQPPRPELWSPYPPPPPPPPPVEATVSPVEPLKPAKPAAVNEIRAVQSDKNNDLLLWAEFRDFLKFMHMDCFDTAEKYSVGFEHFAACLEEAVSEGKLSGPATASLFDAAHDHLEAASRTFKSSARLEDLFVSLLASVARGIKAVTAVDPSFCITKPLFWVTFLERLARLRIDADTTKLFIFAMQKTNTHSGRGRRALEAALSGLVAYFRLWEGSELHGHPEKWDWPPILQAARLASQWSLRADHLFDFMESDLACGDFEGARSKLKQVRNCLSRVGRFMDRQAHLMSNDTQLIKMIAEALRTQKARHRIMLYRRATALLGTHEKRWVRSQYNWLQVMARLREITTPRLKHLMGLFSPRGHSALSHTELCQLLLLHWVSQGKLRDGTLTRDVFNSIQDGKDDAILAALALAIHETTPPNECHAVYWDFWNFLAIRAGPKTLLRHLSRLSKRRKLPSKFLERLAWTSNDNRIALLIHHILVKQEGKVRNFWLPPLWDKFAAKMSRSWKYPLIDPMLITWKMLAPGSNKRHAEEYLNDLFRPGLGTGLERNYRKHLQVVEQRSPDDQLASWHPLSPRQTSPGWRKEVQRVKDNLELLRHAQQITDRQALRHVTAFTRILANKQGYLSARDLAALTTVITRTLDHGRCGSVEIFKWYLGVVYRHLGEEVCVSVGMILKRRRHVNWKLWQTQLKTTLQTQQQEREFVTKLGIHVFSNGQAHGLDPKASELWTTYIFANKRKARRRHRLAQLRTASDEVVTRLPGTKQRRGGKVGRIRNRLPLDCPEGQTMSEGSTADVHAGVDAIPESPWEENMDDNISI